MSDFLTSYDINDIRRQNEALQLEIVTILTAKEADCVKQIIKLVIRSITQGNFDVGRIVVEEGIKYLETAELISLLTKMLCAVNKIMDMKYFAYYKLKEIVDANLQNSDKMKNKTVYRKYNELMKHLLKDETVSNINDAFRNNINFV